MSRPYSTPALPEAAIAHVCDLHSRAIDLYAEGVYAETHTCAQQALHTMEQALGQPHPDVANICTAQDAYAEAMHDAQRSVHAWSLRHQLTGPRRVLRPLQPTSHLPQQWHQPSAAAPDAMRSVSFTCKTLHIN